MFNATCMQERRERGEWRQIREKERERKGNLTLILIAKHSSMSAWRSTQQNPLKDMKVFPCNESSLADASISPV